jgi:hypothetical protein
MMTEDRLISESFDRRTMANMEVALDRALRYLAAGREEHSNRQHVASRILACAKEGEKTLGGLTKAGLEAAGEIPPRRNTRPHSAVMTVR